MISIMVAIDRTRVIGLNNQMPWHLPNDLRQFKEKTTGHTVIMGSKTYESIGRPLPNRKNVVLTRQELQLPDEVVIINDLQEILKWNEENPEEEFFVIGGGLVYEQALPIADRMYITMIDGGFIGDTFFPRFSDEDWTLTSEVKGERNEKNPYDYTYLQYDRKR